MNEQAVYDTEFIADARTDVPELADAVLALIAEVRRLRAALSEQIGLWEQLPSGSAYLAALAANPAACTAVSGGEPKEWKERR